MLATSALAAAQQAVDTSADRFEQAGAYSILHPHLFCQSFRHVGDNEATIDMRGLLQCQLQAGGRPLSPEPSSPNPSYDVSDILAWFDKAPAQDVHNKPFFQDGGDDDGY